MLEPSSISCNFADIFAKCDSVENLTEVYQVIDKTLRNDFANASFKLTKVSQVNKYQLACL